MVNDNKNIKEDIIRHLYLAEGRTVSGMELSNLFKISRTAIWKHITHLKQNGYGIESRPKGYVILKRDDLLMPFCFRQKFQNRIFHYQEVDTTMEKAKSLVKKSIPHLSVVIAENQTAGRGRLNRKWFSSRGGLWFTIILKPHTPPQLSYIYNFAASLSLAESLRKLFDLDIHVKWPNDLLLKEKKLSGLLSEMATKGDMVQYINIGIGLNVNNMPDQYEPKAISLKKILKKEVSRKLILETFLDDFEIRIQTIDCQKIIEQWKQVTSTIGSRVRVETLTETFQGVAIDIDETGALFIKDKKEKIEKIIYGDCFHT